jgi:protein SCO1/2
MLPMRFTRRWTSWVWIGFLWLLSTVSEAAVFTQAPSAPDFVLQRADGGEYRLRAHQGRVRLLYFGFTNCPHICPQTMATLGRLSSRFSEAEREQVEVLFISVDPQRDTPRRVRDFLSRFAGDVIGLIPSDRQLERLAADYNVAARKLEVSRSAGYDMLHTDLVYVVGPGGRLRHAYFAGTAVDDMLGDLRVLLGEAP